MKSITARVGGSVLVGALAIAGLGLAATPASAASLADSANAVSVQHETHVKITNYSTDQLVVYYYDSTGAHGEPLYQNETWEHDFSSGNLVKVWQDRDGGHTMLLSGRITNDLAHGFDGQRIARVEQTDSPATVAFVISPR